jgi:hypothetical protein
MGNMPNKALRKYGNHRGASNTQTAFRTGELDVLEQQALAQLDHKEQVMDKHLDNICSSLDTLHSKLELVGREIQDQTSIVVEVR